MLAAISGEGATDMFERDIGRMVTACKRVQVVDGMDYSAAAWLAMGAPA